MILGFEHSSSIVHHAPAEKKQFQQTKPLRHSISSWSVTRQSSFAAAVCFAIAANSHQRPALAGAAWSVVSSSGSNRQCFLGESGPCTLSSIDQVAMQESGGDKKGNFTMRLSPERTCGTFCLQLAAALEMSQFSYEAAIAAKETFDWSDMSTYVQRQFNKLTDIGTAILPEDDVNRVRSDVTSLRVRCNCHSMAMTQILDAKEPPMEE